VSAAVVASGPRAGRRWSTSEDVQLRRLYAERLPIRQIAARLGRAPDAIVARRKSLRIAPRRPQSWSPTEEALLRAGTAAGLPASLLAERLGRSPDQVRARRRMLVGSRPPGRPYLPGEDAAIRSWLTSEGELTVLAHCLARSPDALRLRARQLGVYHPVPRPRWTQLEDAIVRDGYTSALPCTEIARQLRGRSAASVAVRARRLGLGSYARRWRTGEDQLLIALTARGDTLEDVAQLLGRTPEAIRRHASRHGIKSPPAVPAPRHRRRWTGQEDELLRLHHALNPARLAELLGRSDGAVCRRLCALGLRARAQRSPHHPVSRGNGSLGQ
jgi:DNA-binding CsgD family transcriptional regulator